MTPTSGKRSIALLLLAILILGGGVGLLAPKASVIAATLRAQGGDCASPVDGRFVVASGDELRALLRCAPADAVIALKPGRYGRVDLNGVNGLTLSSQDPNAPATLEFLQITKSSRVTVSHLRFAGNNAGLQFRLQMHESRDIKASDLDFPGTPGRFDDVSLTSVMVRLSDRVELERLKVAWVAFGITFKDVKALTVRDCMISDVRSDGIRGGGAEDLLIIGNTITGFHPIEGDHPDGIQIWTMHQDTSARNIRIIGNLIMRGAGQPAQGIFVTDQNLTLPYRNVEIADNVIIGSLWHGITVIGAADVAVRANSVLGLPDQRSWIMLRHVTGAVAQGNRSQIFELEPGVQQSGNRPGPISRAEIDKAVRQWREKRPPSSEAGS